MPPEEAQFLAPGKADQQSDIPGHNYDVIMIMLKENRLCPGGDTAYSVIVKGKMWFTPLLRFFGVKEDCHAIALRDEALGKVHDILCGDGFCSFHCTVDYV